MIPAPLHCSVRGSQVSELNLGERDAKLNLKQLITPDESWVGELKLNLLFDSQFSE